MRFGDLYRDYRISVLSIKSNIKWSKLPKHRKICLSAMLAFMILGAIVGVLINYKMLLVCWGISIVIGIFMIFNEEKPKNLKEFGDSFTKPYSRKRMNAMVNLLQDYEIDLSDKETIRLLIDQCEYYQEKYSTLRPLYKSLGLLMNKIIYPIAAGIAVVYSQNSGFKNLFLLSLQVVVLVLSFWAFWIAIEPIINEIFEKDYNRYEELKDDLNQIMIFYPNSKQLRERI